MVTTWKGVSRLSFKLRVVLATTVAIVIGIWSLAFYAQGTLRDDMQRLIGEQQLSTASYIAADVNEGLEYRFKMLEDVSHSLNPALLASGAALQQFLEQHGLLPMAFNGGVTIHRLDGTAIAEVPLPAVRIGVNFMDAAAVATALKEGKAAIGPPQMGKMLRAPLFVMTVPIRDARGRVIGAVVGGINLGKANFLDKIAEGHFGKSGAYSLLSPKHRLIIASRDKSRILQPPVLPVIPILERNAQGEGGYGVFVDGRGAEMLGAFKAIPIAGWRAAVAQPTEEAFAPIRAMRQRMFLATLLVTVMTGALVWWMLRRQLAPVLAAADQLGAMADAGQPLHPLPVAGGEFGHLFGGFNRLLETLRQREEALKESEFRWKFALEGARDGVWDANLETQEVHQSKRYHEILGYAEGELPVGRADWLARIHPEDKPRLLNTLQAYSERKAKVYASEYRMRCKDGSYKWVQSRGMVVARGEDGEATRMIGTTTDISERKEEELKLAQVERDLWQALRQVEQRERSKSRFLAATSHDLRQPLFAAQLLVDGLASTPLNVQQLNSVNRVQQSLRAMSNQLQLLLDLSRLEDPNLQLNKQYQPAVSVFESIAEIYAPIAQQANVRLLFHPGEFMLYTDQRLLARLIGMLIDNAIKFSPRGTVLVCTRHHIGSHMIQVRDNGIGMEDVHHGAIFEDFYQIGNEERDPSSGYGLGLSIAARIARILGIEIHIASALGRGSTFSLLMANGDQPSLTAEAMRASAIYA